MNGFSQLGKLLVLFGLVIAVIGLIVILGGRVSWLGRLPGDIYIKRKNFTFYFPLATSLLVSLIITLILMLFRRK
ncbi:MAG: DUF2905 domain-containing protein [Pseudomonadota bacterium]